MGKQIVVLRTFTHHVHVPVEAVRHPEGRPLREAMDADGNVTQIFVEHRYETRDDVGVEFAMWFPVKPGLEAPIPAPAPAPPGWNPSRWPDASAEEKYAIETGRVVEVVEDATFPAGWTVEACLDWIIENRYAPRLAALDARVVPPQWTNTVREA